MVELELWVYIVVGIICIGAIVGAFVIKANDKKKKEAKAAKLRSSRQ